MRICLNPLTAIVTLVCLTVAGETWADDVPDGALDFTVKVDVARQELDPAFCWFHPRAAAVPGAGRDGNPAVIMTVQKHLKVSDYYI